MSTDKARSPRTERDTAADRDAETVRLAGKGEPHGAVRRMAEAFRITWRIASRPVGEGGIKYQRIRGGQMPNRENVDDTKLNNAAGAELPYNLRIADFQIAMQDVYDFFFDVNTLFAAKGLERFDDILRPANMSGLISDMLTASVAKHSRSLTQNLFHNGHPDLIVKGVYPGNAIKSGDQGVEIKTTRKKGGAVDTHGARKQWMCVFVYEIDNKTEPANARRPFRFTEVYLGEVVEGDFRKNSRSELGTRTATLDRQGILRLRSRWIYKLD